MHFFYLTKDSHEYIQYQIKKKKISAKFVLYLQKTDHEHKVTFIGRFAEFVLNDIKRTKSPTHD